MAKDGEDWWSRVKNRLSTIRSSIAKYADGAATTVVVSSAFLAIGSIFIPHDPSVLMIAIAMIGIVLGYFLFLAAAFARQPHEHRFRHVVYQSAAFIILALSLRAFGLHEAIDSIREGISGVVHPGTAQAPMNARSVGELAAVMILFILVEIAAFLAQDVEDARVKVKGAVEKADEIVKQANAISERVEKTTSELGTTIGQIQQLRLVASVAQLDPSVMAGAVKLTARWSSRAPNPALGSSSGISQQCWRVLLRKYLEEEHDDFFPDGRLEGIPGSVRPVGGPADCRDEDVSYFATNVGFYAKFLAELVNDLQTRKTNEQKVCVAVVTNVLPAHWWNWTFAADEWRAYAAIDGLRTAMMTIADKGAQIDRVIAVNPVEEPVSGAVSHEPKGRLWSEDLLYDMLLNWQILADRSPEKPAAMADCSKDFQTTRGEIGSVAFASFPKALQNGACSELTGARIYPMITKSETRDYTTINHVWKAETLRKAYEQLQGIGEPGNGKYWVLPVKPPVAKDLDGHFDVMFIGLGPAKAESRPAGIWARNDIKWGMCLMNSSDAAVETMFLSVISDDSARTQFEWWKNKLDGAVEWEKCELPKAAGDWQKKFAPVPDPAPKGAEKPPDPLPSFHS